jgi:hypothetical protein
MPIEHSRRHGLFDPRFPPAVSEPPPGGGWLHAEKGLGWQPFLVRFFPGSSRHDSAALVGYEAYRSKVAGKAPPLLLTPDIDRWEGEGGAPRDGRGGSRRSARRVVA